MVESTQDDITVEHRLTVLESYIENHNLHTRVVALEHWKFIVLGAAILVGTLITLFADEIKSLVLQ